MMKNFAIIVSWNIATWNNLTTFDIKPHSPLIAKMKIMFLYFFLEMEVAQECILLEICFQYAKYICLVYTDLQFC